MKVRLLSKVSFIEGNSDIVDLLLLSKSKLIVISATNTSSYWAAFISDNPVIMHPAHLHANLRPSDINSRSYEGAFDSCTVNELLHNNIKSLKN